MDESTEEEVQVEDETSNESEEQDSLRADLEAAIETEQEETTGEESEEEGETEEANSPEKNNKEKPETEAGKIGDEESSGKNVPSGINAPIGFSPESREKWKDVPDIVKGEIQKREKQITEAMANTAESRRTHSAIGKLAESYAPVLAAEGVETPMKAIESLFRTVAELRMGTPQQTATKMAGLIKHYNIDIGMLDAVLSGDMSAQNTDDSRLAKMLDDRLAPVQDLLKGNAAREEATARAAQAAVNDELKKFAEDAEFLNDVRDDMADLIDLASKRGVKMTFEDAYKKACSMHPTISGIMEKRVKDEALKNSGERLNKKRNAASSIAQNTGAPSGKAKDLSLRGEISEAWDSFTE